MTGRKTMTIRVPLPTSFAMLWANLLGLAGLLGIALAVGGLTRNWWWSVLLGAVFAVGLAYIAQLGLVGQTEPAPPRPARAAAPLRSAS